MILVGDRERASGDVSQVPVPPSRLPPHIKIIMPPSGIQPGAVLRHATYDPQSEQPSACLISQVGARAGGRVVLCRRALGRGASSVVYYLFSYRGIRAAPTYLNRVLTPTLCRRAGVPERDTRGPIAGHRSLSSTQHYAAVSPTRLAKTYLNTGYFERNVATAGVLIDKEALQSGEAATGEPWEYFDLGHGYCTYSFLEQCQHRMACVKCPFYLPKASTKALLLESKANLTRMVAMILLTEEERAAVEGGVELFEQLPARLAYVPTPAGPSPRELAGRQLAVLPSP